MAIIRKAFSPVLVTVALSASFTLAAEAPPVLAQEQDDPPRPVDMQQPDEGQPPMGQASPEMREMARSMKSMAEKCARQ